MTKKMILLGVTGSIAAYKACDLVSLLKEQGHEVRVVMTKEAEHFITPLTLATLSENPVFSEMFALPPKEWNAIHIALAKEADVVAVVPATANIIGKLAHGICDDLLTCVMTATQAPILLAPAMNTQMYEHPVIQENITKLRRLGVTLVEPEEGRLACGTEGVGHIATIEKIAAGIQRLLINPDSHG